MSGWAQSDHKSTYKMKAGRQSQRGNKCSAAGFKDGGINHETKNAGGFQKLKKKNNKKINFPLQT